MEHTITEKKSTSKTDREIKEPGMFKVLMHNDDYTTMDFVVNLLINIFHKTHPEALKIMLNIHRTGIGLCGVYTYEIAESKVHAVYITASKNGFPLKCSIEKD